MPTAPRSRAASLAVAALATIACHDVGVPTATADAMVAAEFVRGDGQSGNPGDTLSEPIVVRVHDRQGRPFAFTPIEWFADGGGSLIDASTRTDSAGNATAHWVIGSSDEPQRVRVRPVRGDEQSTRADILHAPALANGKLQLLTLPTYDGSGEAVHPDVISTSTPLHQSPFLMVVTPYPSGDATKENPSVLVSRDGIAWSVPTGASNPLVIPPPTGGYLSDPDLVYVGQTHTFWLFYREVQNRATNLIHVATSQDGLRWKTKDPVIITPAHALVSPSVVHRPSKGWMMWTVDAGVGGCSAATTHVDLRSSTDGINWGEPTPVSITSPMGTPWHIDVQWIRSRQEYWAIFNVKVAGNCATKAVYIATSRDGIEWTTLPTPAITSGAIPEFRDIVYRASIQYVPSDDVVTLWFSGASSESGRFVWRVAVERQLRADLFTALAIPYTPPAELLAAQRRRAVAFSEP
jgi:hypothetical protein